MPPAESRHARRRRAGDKHASGPSGISGVHREPRRACQATTQQLASWDAKAAAAGLTWAAWVRALQDRAVAGRAALSAPLEGPFPKQRVLTATGAQWRAWDAAARARSLSWSDWVRRLQDAA